MPTIAENLSCKTADTLNCKLRNEFPDNIFETVDNRGNDGVEGDYTWVVYINYSSVDLDEMRRFAKGYLEGIYDKTHSNIDWMGDVPTK